MNENLIGPLWNKPLDLTQRMMDPLSLSRVSEWIVDELLPGFTTLTTRARNYSFYCWALNDIIQRNKGKKSVNIADEMNKRESAFVLASIRHNCNRDIDPIGVIKAKRRLNSATGDVINVKFVVLQNKLGGFGQYYQNAMDRLNIIFRTSGMSIPTPKGKELSEAFEKQIQDTEYYKKNIEKEEVPLDVLSEYGAECCVCQLSNNKVERDLLTEVFFERNKQNEDLDLSRKNSLLLVLKSIELCSKNGIKFSDAIFRNIIFFNQIKNEDKIIDFYPISLKENLDRWRFFQFHEYLTFVLETLLHCFLLEIEQDEKGLTLEEFFRHILGYKSKIAEALNTEVEGCSIEDIMKKILDKTGNLPLTITSSKEFDKKVQLGSPVNEETLTDKINDSLKKKNITEAVGNSLALLLVNMTRFYQYKDNLDEIYLWYYNRAIQDLSHPLLFEEEKILEEKNLDFFIDKLYKIIIETHDEIAYDKLYSGSDTFRFRETAGRYHFENMYKATERNTRIDSIINVLMDIGAIKETKNIIEISDYGNDLLRSMINE